MSENVRHRHVTVGGSHLHVAEAGDPDGRPVLLLHGWPQTWRAWTEVMGLAAGQGIRPIAVDLPGVGGSTGDATDGSKQAVADVVHGLVEAMGLRDTVLVGHDIGAMVVHSYVRTHDDMSGAVLVDAAVPGIPPWDEVLANPYIWHFAFHALPDLPEQLVRGRERVYLDFFFDAVSADGSRITQEARADYAEAYSRPEALTAGFDWYRTFAADAEHNRTEAVQRPVKTPLLYLHSGYQGGDAAVYAEALADAGCASVGHDTLSGYGHFLPEEAPAELWARIAAFLP
ncbi:alpha/beta fold hydrolase [Pseudonocardia endophytica]|uniref:Pimeloyl-ACP methyl ester carboxylesterase n=1 Tax=Pseudonocardia endophytica TaxID=401976 RepID=A0A4R1HIT3_PSEEN|nr:alpha/beta hydrolase [Pseudonocardia endophytica]TCK22204.1 pimeloyl-ACP methyl ester carboxylesterase [Pseudonocardia endophytica]